MPSYTPWQLANSAIYEGNVAALRQLLADNPALIHHVTENSGFPTLLHYAAQKQKIDCVKLLLELGANLNLEVYGTSTVLAIAISNWDVELVEYLLASGADARIGGPLITAVRQPEPWNLRFAELLVERGALVNEYYHPYDDPKQPLIGPLSFALDHVSPKIAEYLISKGAKLPPEK